jgi:WD40 repeat protein
MGINDFCFAEDGQIVTCSSDRTVKQWKINDKTLDEERTLNLSEFDATGLKDNVEKQQLGILLDA